MELQIEITKAFCRAACKSIMSVFDGTLTDEDFYIAGGCIRSCLIGEDVKDVDIFLKNELKIQELKDCQIGFISNNAISLNIGGLKFQIILTATGIPLEVVNEFDFVMNSNYYSPASDNLYIANIEVIKNKELRINPNCRNKLGTLARLHKFLERGYKVTNRNDLLQLGVALTQLEPIHTFEAMEAESKLYFSEEQYNEIDFVGKRPDEIDEGFHISSYESTASYRGKLAGSGV